MKLPLCFLLSTFCFSAFAQTVNQISVPTWSATGIKYKWLTRVPNKVIGLDADGLLTLTTAGGGLQDNFLLNDFEAETLTTGQAGMGWDENGYFTIGSSAGWLQIYEAGDPLENTIHFAGRFTADAIEAASITGDITGPQVASGQIPGGVMAASMPRPMLHWQNSATYAGANGLTYAATGPGGQTEPQTPAMYFAGIEVIDGDPNANYLQGRIRSASQMRSDLGLVIGTNVLAYTAPGTSGNVLTSNGSAWVSSAAAGGGITIGTTTSNGTAGRVLYTDGTNVQAYDKTGSGSTVVMSGGPTFAGPVTITGGGTYLYFSGAGSYLQLGGSSAPSIFGVTQAYEVKNGTQNVGLRVYNTETSATNYERAVVAWASNTLSVGTQKGSGGGTARDMILVTDDTERVRINSTGLTIASGLDLKLGNTAVAETPTATHTLIIKDSAGVSYRVLAVPLP